MTRLLVWHGSRTVVVLTTLALAAGGVVALVSSGTSWRGSWKTALDWGTGSLVLVGPLAAGFSAWVYGRMREAAFERMASTATRPVRAWLGPALVTWVQATIVLVLVTAAATSAAALTGVAAYASLSWVLLHAEAVLAAQVALGALMGALTGRYWAAPLAAVLVFVLGVLSSVGVVPGVFDTGGVSGSLAGETFSFDTLARQATAALGIAAACAWGLLRFLAVVPATVRVSVLVTACLGVVAYASLDFTGYQRYVPAEETRLLCAGSLPRVCLAEETARPLHPLAGEFARQARVLKRHGLPVPERVVQELPGVAPRPRDGVLVVPADELTASRVAPFFVSYSLATPRGCPGLTVNRPRSAALASRFLLARWIASEAGVVDVSRADADHAWLTKPRQVQLPWVRSTYRSLQRCRLAALALPSG